MTLVTASRQVRRNVPWVVVALLVLAAFAPIGLKAWHNWAGDGSGSGGLSLSAPLPQTVPPGTKLIIGDPTTEKVLKVTGWDRQLPFKVQWANISGGPGVTEAFHAGALDIGSAANIPPINAVWVGIPVKIVAVRLRNDPVAHPLYVFGISPKAHVDKPSDLRGKRIAFSRGQAQGAVVLRELQAIGLTPRDVQLIDLPTNGAVYNGALASGAIDVAPLGNGTIAQKYLAEFGKDGARLLPHAPFRDDPAILYVRDETLRDPAKAAAIRAYVQVWARAIAWVNTHRDAFAEEYYVKREGLAPDAARLAVAAAGNAYIPGKWDDFITYQQNTIDLMSKGAGQKDFAAGTIFDRRFEAVAVDAFQQYTARAQAFASR